MVRYKYVVEYDRSVKTYDRGVYVGTITRKQSDTYDSEEKARAAINAFKNIKKNSNFALYRVPTIWEELEI